MSLELPQNQNPQENSSKDKRISDAEQMAFDLLMPKHKDLAINLDDFKDIYGPEEISRDKRSIENKHAKMVDIDSAFHKRAQLLEAILAEQIELSDWFGENAMTIVPAEYDDLFNGIDLTTEFEQEGGFQYIAMGIDVTSSGHPVKKKLDTIKAHIKDGTLTQMKYFKSEKNDIQGRMGRIPQLVIGADARTINELSNLWLTVYRSRNPEAGLNKSELDELREKAKEAQVKLAKHRASVLILEEIREQLLVFSNYAEKVGLQDVKDKFISLLKLVNRILEQKHISVSDRKDNEEDDVYRSLKEKLSEFLLD